MPEKKLPTSRRPSAGDASPAENGQAGMFSLLGTASTMGLHMVSGPIVGGALGWLMDGWLDSWPIGAGIGVLLGVAAGFRNVWTDAKFLIREQDKAGSKETGAASSAASPPSPAGPQAPQTPAEITPPTVTSKVDADESGNPKHAANSPRHSDGSGDADQHGRHGCENGPDDAGGTH